MKQILTAVSAMALLAACGGSSTSNLTDRLSGFESLTDDASMVSETPDANFPTTGTGNYEGYLTIAEFGANGTADDPTFAAIGDANVQINFGSGNVSGSASNFSQLDLSSVDFEDEDQDVNEITGTSIGGSLSVVDNGDGIAGTLTHANGNDVDYALTVTDSAYGGNNAEFLSVEASGDTTSDDRSDRPADAVFLGFDASR